MRFSRAVRNVITASFALAAIFILPIMLFVPSLAFSQGLLFGPINFRLNFSLS